MLTLKKTYFTTQTITVKRGCGRGARVRASFLRNKREHRQIPRRKCREDENEKEGHGHDCHDQVSEIAAGFVRNACIADGRKKDQAGGGKCGRYRDENVGAMDCTGSSMKTRPAMNG